MPTMQLFPDPATVTLEPYIGWQDSPTGETPVEHNQWMVFIHCEALAKQTPKKKIMVGYIGKQPGANFMPVQSFGEFSGPQRDWIAAEAKKAHGAASSAPHSEANLVTSADFEALKAAEAAKSATG